MNVNPYVVQNGDINYLNGKTIVQYNGSAFQIGAGAGAGNTFQGFSYAVDQINVTHEPQYEYTVTKPGTVMITVEGTQRQDGYGIGTTLLSMDLWQLTGG